MKIAFFGDGILDRYRQIVSMKIDPSSACPVYELAEASVEYRGGALNASHALRHFCESFTLAPVMLEIDRHQWQGRDVHRIDKRRKFLNPAKERQGWLSALTNNSDGVAAIVVSDYLKGIIDAETLNAIIAHARAKGIPCVLDAKRIYPGVDYSGAIFKCNAKEAVSATDLIRKREAEGREGCAPSEFDDAFCASYFLPRPAIVTRGEKSPVIATPGNHSAELVQLVFPSRPFEPCGAGDVFAAFLALRLAEGASLEASAFAAHRAAAAAGFFPPFREPVLQREIDAITDISRLKLLKDKNELLEWCELRTPSNLVVTNGVFDLLHSGHVQNLAECRSQGDALLVLVNSDESARAVKGAGRPVISLKDRMRMLASLECVDAVCAFNELTPVRVLGDCVKAMDRNFACICKGPDATLGGVPGAAHADRVHHTVDYGERSSAIISRSKSH